MKPKICQAIMRESLEIMLMEIQFKNQKKTLQFLHYEIY